MHMSGGHLGCLVKVSLGQAFTVSAYLGVLRVGRWTCDHERYIEAVLQVQRARVHVQVHVHVIGLVGALLTF